MIDNKAFRFITLISGIIDHYFIMENFFKKLEKNNKLRTITTQKIKFSIKDFLSKCAQICSFLRIWSHFLKKSLMEN